MIFNVLYVIYDLYSTKVIDVFDQTSLELLQIVEDEDIMYTYPFDHMVDMKTLPSNNMYARSAMKSFFRSVYLSKNGGWVSQSIESIYLSW